MTIETHHNDRRRVRPLVLLTAAVLAVSLAAVTARAALAGTQARYLSPNRSFELVRNAFADVADRPFREPKVVVAPTSAATWALADDVNVANRVWNPRTARPWSPSDARTMWPAGMGGFTDPSTGDVYVNGETAVESVLPHEMLHANASPEFLQTVGVALNEGVTEQLALDALAVGGVRAEKMPPYAAERAMANAVVRIVGRELVLRAYFNGGPALTDFVRILGAETLARIKAQTAGTDTGAALRTLEAAAAAA